MKTVVFLMAVAGLASAFSPASNLEQRFREQYAQPQPAWVGYTVPGTPDHHDSCDYGDHMRGTRPPGPVHLEPPDRVQILFRIQNSRVGKIRVISGDCELDADA